MQETDYTDDWFLTDRLLVRQPRRGFRAGTDSLLVAASVLAKPGDRVVELGVGVGTASLALSARVSGLRHTMCDLDPDAVAFAEHNWCLNQQKQSIAAESFRVIHGDALANKTWQTDPHSDGELFDWSFCNPPFFDARSSRPSADPAKELARQSARTIADWVDAMVRLTRAGGGMSLICRAESLGTVLAAMDGRVGGIELIAIHPKPSQPAVNILVRGYRDSRAKLKILPSLTIRAENGSILAKIERMQRHGNVTI